MSVSAPARSQLAQIKRRLREQIAELGMLMNYNAYGETVADLRVDPATLFVRMAAWVDPREFIAHDPFVGDLRATMGEDLAAARRAPVLHEDPGPPPSNCRPCHGRGAHRGYSPTNLPATIRSAPTPSWSKRRRVIR